MIYYNLKEITERVGFAEATMKGLGSKRGLYHPGWIPQFDAADLVAMSRFDRYQLILGSLMAPDFSEDAIAAMLPDAFPFEATVVHIAGASGTPGATGSAGGKADSSRARSSRGTSPAGAGGPVVATVLASHSGARQGPAGDSWALELFHGPTLAFKDFGARWMARCLANIRGDKPVTILTATSGDTGAAVAHAFHNVPGVRVVVLYPDGRISRAQEQLFCTLGGNIDTIAVRGSFDDCQTMVKNMFEKQDLRDTLGLNSANSINVSRLVAQVLYYWDLVAALPAENVAGGHRGGLVVSVPSGNFGDLTAGLVARAMGAPIRRFIAATNVNDTVPRYLSTGRWEPKETIPTTSNAMDVSEPSNWPRTARVMKDYGVPVSAVSVDEAATVRAMRELDSMGYTAEPHAAVAWAALGEARRPGETGAFLCTAHPAKFAGAVEAALGRAIPLPAAISDALARPNLSVRMEADSFALEEYLRG